jgi:hypothetical protein
MIGELTATSEIAAPDREAMCALLEQHYLDVTRAQFERDLADKQWAILLRDDDGVVRGFSTLAVAETCFHGERLYAVYSGDTIVHRNHWGSSALARTWITAVRELRERVSAPLVWLLICSGYRTYRVLPVFFREFYPRHDGPTPAHVQELMHELARARYGSAYDPDRGLVVLDHPTPLREDLVEVSGTRRDAHIEHFLRLNPGHERGDELVCFCPLDDDNLSAAGWRMVRAGMRAAGQRAAPP